MRAIDDWVRSDGDQTVVVRTSCEGSLPKRVLVGIAGLLRAAWMIRWTTDALVHVHSASRGSFLRKSLVLLAARLNGKPVLLHIHGGGFSSFANSGSKLRKAWVAAALRQADAICVVNADTGAMVRRLNPRAQVVVLPNPATLLCGRVTECRQPRVLFLGRLGVTKGTDVLLEAIRLLQTAGVSAEYVLAGDGEIDATRTAVVTLPLPEAVRVPGWLESMDVHRLLHESSVFCLPSRREGMPMALLQAMGHGLACVVTSVGGMGEIVTDGVSGLVVPPEDPWPLAVAMGSVLEDADLRWKLGQNAARDVAGTYSVETAMTRLREVYSSLLSEGDAHGGT
jgi:glycosyltransferase involved in cell wall biosynthesis